jgi:hypothetical protein
MSVIVKNMLFLSTNTTFPRTYISYEDALFPKNMANYAIFILVLYIYIYSNVEHQCGNVYKTLHKLLNPTTHG